jgi:hypothetical protein
MTSLASLYVDGRVDVDRVHDGLTHKLNGRGVGTTSTLLLTMLGEAMFARGHLTYVYLAPTHQMARYALNGFCDLLDAEELVFRVIITNNTVKVYHFEDTELVFHFIEANGAQIDGQIRGRLFDGVFIDIPDDFLDSCQETIAAIKSRVVNRDPDEYV